MEIKKGIQIETNGKIYILRKGLGSGGNGQVWLAKASDDSQEYAIHAQKHFPPKGNLKQCRAFFHIPLQSCVH